MEIKKNIIIVAPSTLPIPAVESGAYEQLIELVINENELNYKVNFTVISLKSAKTKMAREKYRNTKFIDFENNFILRVKNKISKYITILTNKNSWYNYHINQITDIIKNSHFDKVLIFGGVHHIKPISEIVCKDKMVFYLATEILNNAQDFNLCHKVVFGNKRMISLLNDSNIEFPSTELVNLVPGIDINYFTNFNHDNFQALRKKLNIDLNTTVITYVGRVVNSKGVSVLLNSCLKLHKSCKFKIILIGSLGSNFGSIDNGMVQSDTGGIRELIEKLGPNCISTGFVKVEDLPDYLSLTDIGVVPSICEDVAPVSYLQFLCLGKATVVSDAGGIPEFYSDDYSLMFKRGESAQEELANHLEFLIKNPEIRIKMGQNALRMRPNLSKERYYDELINLILN